MRRGSLTVADNWLKVASFIFQWHREATAEGTSAARLEEFKTVASSVHLSVLPVPASPLQRLLVLI